MEITITGYSGENVIAQLIEDLLSVNGLSVKRDEINPVYEPLTIEQLDRQIAAFKKNKTKFNLKVIKEEVPKYLPKKMPKFKNNFPDMASLITRTAARMAEVQDEPARNGNFDIDDLFERQVAVAAVAAPEEPRRIALDPELDGIRAAHIYEQRLRNAL